MRSRRRGPERLAWDRLGHEERAPAPARRRVIGLEHRYAVEIDISGRRRLVGGEAARYLFQPVVAWCGGTDAYVSNGGRLYLPGPGEGVAEYATPECDGVHQAVTYAKAGEVILADLARMQERRLLHQGSQGAITIRHDRSPAGGCHESYLSEDAIDPFVHTALVPFLVSRQVYAGSGGLVRDARGVRFLLSPRGEHVREGIGRPAWDRTAIADLKAPPLAGGRRCRRVHVVAGEGNHSEPATFLKVGATALVLRLLEERPDAVPDLTLDDPVAAIQAVSADSTGRARLRLATGRDTSALGLQATFLDGVHHLVATEGSSTEEDRVLRLWEACLTGLESEATALSSTLDWVARRSSLEAVADSLLDPRAADVDRAWDVVYPEVPTDAVPHHPAMDRICSPAEVSAAGPPTNLPPETTRARLRSQFVRACRANDRQYAVDWTHLMVRDQLQTSVALDDPLVSSDSRVDRLLALLEQSPEAASESS